jgi:hypothetical protein
MTQPAVRTYSPSLPFLSCSVERMPSRLRSARRSKKMRAPLQPRDFACIWIAGAWSGKGLAVDAVCDEPVSQSSSLQTGNSTGKLFVLGQFSWLRSAGKPHDSWRLRELSDSRKSKQNRE